MRLLHGTMLVWGLFAVLLVEAITSGGVVRAAFAGAAFPLVVTMLVWLIQEDRR